MESNNSSNTGKLVIFFLALFIFAILLAYHASAAIENPSVYWKLDTDTLDKTGNGFDGTADGSYQNTTNYILGGGSRYFNGDGQDVHFSSIMTLSNNFSINIWVNLTAFSNTFAIPIGKEEGASDFWGRSSGGLMRIFNGSDNCEIVGQPIPALSVYEMWTVTHNANNGNTSFYVNGTHLGSTTCLGLNFEVGRIGDSYDAGFHYLGALDEFALWNATRINETSITSLYAAGAGLPYPYDTGTPTSINLTITDDFTGSTISNFSILLSWNNGSTEQHTTTTGSINLHNVSYDSHIINVTYYNITNYFNASLYNQSITANTTNTITTATYQAIANLSGFEKITNNSLSDVTFYIGSKSGTLFNLTAGTHNVIAEKPGYYNLSSQITVIALSNTSYTIEGLYNTIVNFTAYNAINNASISDFTINTSFGEGGSTTNGSITFNVINNTFYNFNISSPGLFTSRNNLNFTTNSSLYRVNTSLYTFNSIRFNIFNESSMAALTQLVTIHTISNLTTFSNTTTSGFIIIDLLQPTDYEIRFESADFNPRSLFLTVTNDSTQNITVYMTENITTETQRIEVLDTANQPVEGAIVWLQKEHINESERWITIQEARTDYNGETSVFVERDVTIFYRFAVIYNGEARPIQPSGNLFTGPTTFIPGIDETIQLIIDLEEDPEDFISDDLAISVVCNMSNTTAICTIIDGRNSISGAELRLEASYINESLAWENIVNDSFTGSSGTLQVNITAINNSIWRARAYVLYTDSEALVWEDSILFNIDVIIEKNTGLLYAVIILAVVFGLTVTWGPLPSSLIGVCALIPLTAIKIISVPIGVITGLLALCVIFFFRTRKNTE